jgi:hypothetical protein
VVLPSVADFGGVQGGNGWRYCEHDGVQCLDMTWDAAQSRWQGSSQYLLVGIVSQHPDGGRDSVRAWTAPKAGTVTLTSVTGDITVAGGPQRRRRAREGHQEWGQCLARLRLPLHPGRQLHALRATTLTVAAGDVLYFHVEQNVTTSYDTTNWRPAIAYVS